MTTTVIIRTHDWPVEARTFPLGEGRVPAGDGAWSEPERIAPNSERTFHIHDGIDLMLHELAIDDTGEGDPDDTGEEDPADDRVDGETAA